MTRWVLAAVVILLSCMGLATSPPRFVSRRTGLRKRPILSCLKAVNPHSCAPQYAPCARRRGSGGTGDAGMGRNAVQRAESRIGAGFTGMLPWGEAQVIRPSSARADFASMILGSDR